MHNAFMKIISAALLLALLVTPSIAFAEWVYIDRLKSESGVEFDLYDDSKFKIDGNSVYVWDLRNFVEETTKGLKSVTVRKEYDCGIMRRRTIAIYGWDGPMGTGTPMRQEPETEWVHLSPGSDVYKYTEHICSEAGL